MGETWLFYAALILGLPLSLGYLALTTYHFVVRRRPFQGMERVATSLALAAFPLAVLHLLFLLVTSGSSTAVVGVVYAPVYATLWAGAVFLLCWAIAVIGAVLIGRLPLSSWRRLAAAIIVLIIAAWGMLLLWQRQARVDRASSPTSTAEELRALWREQPNREDPAVLAALAGHPNLPPDVLLELAESGLPALRKPPRPPLWFLLWRPLPETGSVLERVASHPDTPVAGLRRLAADPSPAVAAAVARNPNTPPDLLAELARRPEPVVAGEVAVHPATPPEVLAALSNHLSDAVRNRIAQSSRVPAPVLGRLARDTSSLVRGSVARNQATPPEVLAALAGDPDSRVRFDVATNPRTPAAAIGRLSNDPDKRVRRYAAQRLEAREPR